MTGQLSILLTALVPLFALIALGYTLRAVRFVEAGFWPQMERLVYFVLFPALLVDSLATAAVDARRFIAIALAATLALGVMAIVLLALRRRIGVDGAAFSSVFQGGVRFNTYLGIATALGVYGANGGAVAAMVAAVMIPLVNILSVGVLVRYARGSASALAVISGILRNPLVLACALGIALNTSGVGLPLGSDTVLGVVGQAALPLGLIAVGAGLRLSEGRGRLSAIVVASVLKLAILPLLALAAAAVVGLNALETRVLVLFAALPTATSAYILARQMGGDHGLVAATLTAQTIAAALTLPLILLLLGPP